jgi:hypothetical protein
MTFNRRSFFAVLFAPLVAKLGLSNSGQGKRNPQLESLDATGTSGTIYGMNTNHIEWYFSQRLRDRRG